MIRLTPMMAQYKQIKEKYKDCILMYRLGDFYEMFFEDAIEASKILQITLTSRNKGTDNNAPMCGIPYHAVDNYLAKLTRAGKKIAICDQMTEPDGKGIVEREVMRVVTPGTTFDENILEQKANNYVSCVVKNGDSFGFAYSDVTTGEFKVTEINSYKNLESEMMRISPTECILDSGLLDDKVLNLIFAKVKYLHVFPYDYFKEPESDLKNYFQVKSLQGFGLDNKKLAISSSGMLFEYLRETQKTDLKHIQKISYYKISEFMPMDQALIKNLELFYAGKDGGRDGSLISVLDQTVSAMGGRLLKNWLIHPLLNKSVIEQRLNNVEIFVGNSSLLRDVRETLGKIFDIERLLSRLSLGTGNARDLIAMQESLKIIPALKNLIGNVFSDYDKQLDGLENLVALIERAIVEEPPLIVREGGMIKNGYNQELDELLSISTEGKTFITDLQKKEIARTGINSLKIRFNSVFGYYIEISKTNLGSVPEDYIRKQTLVNAERFITPELKEYEEKVLNAEAKIKELEYELFYGVRIEVVKEIIKIQTNARVIAELDVLAALAYTAMKNNYCKPKILDEGVLEIKNGRHPVIEQLTFSGDFVPNDCVFDNDKRFLLITGPNMGGKSTYLRQVALIVLMAQIGSYVPAGSCKLGLVDRIFTRVGANDNLTAGESTFMVEMNEAAFILNQATDKSLIIFDEVGRGTSTYDGVSIAWAIMEFVHDSVKAKTLFATHYHELIELAEKLPNAVNLSVAVKENESEGVVFLYKVVDGGVDKSYGIEVAKLAGLPVNVVSRARGVLKELENRHIKKDRVNPDQIDLFGNGGNREHGKIASRDGDMTPLQAIQKF
ncbi:DNA mismatch repair protein MutS [Candidatus Peregrinibacteria bacterium RIFCSPLOWO2_01_FULL_39_12]|nr:MAG: DNA mismatch repair protein MutS [Candidatus Peregrinibacteria bacterium RIFCSPLOWO2_01_FULL_39_12]